MELKNIFKMTKTDRYTQDGRDELAKLQETEDVKYKTGDISQKTGLQKQPDGSWAPPKKGGKTGAARGSTQSKSDRNAKLYEGGIKAIVGHAWNTKESWSEEELQNEYDLDKTEAKQVKEKLDSLANPKKVDNSDLYEMPGESKPDAAEQRDQIGAEIKESLEAAKYYLDKANSFYPSDPSYKTYMEKAKKAHDEAKAQADDNGFYFEEMHDPGVTRAIKKYSEGNKPDKVGDFLKAYERGDFGKYQQNAERRKVENFFNTNKGSAAENKPAKKKRPKAIRWSRENMQTMHENADYITPQQADNFYHQYGLDKTGEHKDRKGWTIKEYKNDDGDIYRAKFNQQDKYIGYDFEPAAGSKLESDFDDEGDSTGTNWREKVEQNPRDGYNFEKMIQHRIPTSQTDKEELKGLRSFMNEEKATYQNALKSRAQALVDGHKSNGDWYPEKEQAIMKIAKAVGFDKELHKFIEEENRGYDLGYSEDSAPKIRELTGDCKIKIRPETQDVKYNTGDISQKTGLQKQPDGSWAPPRKGGAGVKKAEGAPSHSGMDAEQYDKKLRQEGWKQTGEYSKNAAGHNVGYFEKNGKRIQVVENSEGRIAGVDEVKPKTETKPTAGNNLKWNEMPNGRVWTSRTDAGKPLTVTWNREKNGDVWYGRSDSEIKYKSKEEAMNAPVNEPDWMKKIGKEFKDVIAKNPKLQQYLNRGSTSQLTVPGEGTYLGEAAVARYRELSKEYNENARQGRKTDGEHRLRSIELDEQTARDLIENYMNDSAPRILTGDTKIRIRK